MTNRPPTKPEDLFRVEKERALTVRNSQHARLLAEAKAAFDKLMAEGQAARKSGRPRKHPLPPLKTSSARPVPAPAPVKPVAPPEVVTAAAPAPARAQLVADVAKPKSATVNSGTANSAMAKGAKTKSAKTKSAKTTSAKTKSAKAKPKAKRSTRR
jgi:hypothetical protein